MSVDATNDVPFFFFGTLLTFFLGSFSFSGSSLSFSTFFFFTFFPSIREHWWNQRGYIKVDHISQRKKHILLPSFSLWIAGLSSSDTSSLFLVFVFLGLASFPFSLASVVPFASSFFFFGFYRFCFKHTKQSRLETLRVEILDKNIIFINNNNSPLQSHTWSKG